MNAFKAVQSYISAMLGTVPDMKVLVLDADTIDMIANIYSQTDIIARQVLLVKKLEDLAPPKKKKGLEKKTAVVTPVEEKQAQTTNHLTAIVYVRPTEASVELLGRVLRKPTFKEYHIFFTNILPDKLLRTLAQNDRFDLVRHVQESYADFYALDEGLFHCNVMRSRPFEQPRATWLPEVEASYIRTVEVLLASFLALKKLPTIRYQATSELARGVAEDITKRIKDESTLFHTPNEAVLLILDRREDPVTPLLQQWTYQAMVHELLGIYNNRVDLKEVPEIKKELKEVVLSSQQDKFYQGAMYLTFGELGSSIKQLVQDYQQKHPHVAGQPKLDSIEDMQRFVENYPEFRQMAGTVSKHVAITGELSRLVGKRELLKVSELEQELACSGTGTHATVLESLLALLRNEKIRFDEKLRLVMLYAIRYAQLNELQNVKAVLREKVTSPDDEAKLGAVDAILQYSRPSAELYGASGLLGRLMPFQLKDVQNVYTRHRPLLVSTLQKLVKGQLLAKDYPFVDHSLNQAQGRRVQHVIAFIIGGVTYEEQVCVSQFNAAEHAQGVNVLLGGSCIHNTRSFIEDVLQLAPKKRKDSQVDLSTKQFLFEEKTERESL